jgi:uncharacterized membrane protein YcaP (DUF421 family)
MDWSSMFYQDWSGIMRTLIVGTLAYGALIVSLRVSGKRTLAKLNAFDLIVTVALGSTLATIVLSEDVALAEGVAALLLLIVLQYVVAFVSVRSRRFARAVRSEPSLLVRDGALCPEAMRRARVTEEELETVLRTNGERRFEAVEAIILESDGSFSVIGGGRPRGHADAGR